MGSLLLKQPERKNFRELQGLYHPGGFGSAFLAIFKALTPGNFGSPANMLSYFQASLIATVGAVGFYFVMVMGMFDFSIGANIMLSAIVGCVFASRFGMGYAGLIIGSVLTGTIVGLLNGVFYVKLRSRP